MSPESVVMHSIRQEEARERLEKIVLDIAMLEMSLAELSVKLAMLADSITDLNVRAALVHSTLDAH